MRTRNSGHLPGQIRDAFLEALDANDWRLASRLAGTVWNCTDIIPGVFYDSLRGDFQGSRTYAAVARYLRSSFDPR